MLYHSRLMRIVGGVLSVICLLFLAPLAVEAQQVAESRRTAITQAVEAVSPAVVTVQVEETRRVRNPRFAPYDDAYVQYFLRQSPYRDERVQGVGSGFVVSADGYVVTNDHVVGEATAIDVLFPDGRSIEDYVARIYDFRPGDTVRLRLLRDGESREVSLRIGRRDEGGSGR